MLLAALVPKLIGFRACIPRSLSATISSSSSSSSGSSTSVNDNKRQLRPLTLDESLQLKDKSSYLHAAHCLLYCKITDNDAECIFGLCQVRFDGKLGFPGGAVGNKYEEIHETGDIIKGLERELEEEINYTSMPSESLTHENNGYIHISSYLDESIDKSDPANVHVVNVFHFFAKQISEQEFKNCEESHFKSLHFPLEGLGLFRIPLIEPSNCSDQSVFRYYKQSGGFLANFFKHNFSGIAKNQLFDTLVYLDCLTPDYLAKLDQIIQKV